MTAAVLQDGWIRVPYDGPELGVIEIGVGEDQPADWKPAFLDTVGTTRYAQVRPWGVVAGSTPRVWLRVNGQAGLIGRLGEAASERRTRRQR